ncbi:MAG: type II secretion system F family protein [Parachlamydiales bacterium]|nr:type II secretion system F family protein [Parachlamydiales bacterium]
MAIFEYLAINPNGEKVKSVISADALSEAKAILYAKKVVVYKIYELKSKIKPLSKKEVLDFISDLKSMLIASLPLYEALFALFEKQSKRNIKYLVLDISEKIKLGESFSYALRQHSKSFDFVICSMIENAQKTGTLVETLQEIEKNLKSSIKLKNQIVSAFTYPLILSIFCFVILIALMFFIVPTLFDLFEEKSLHPFTKIVLNTSKFLSKNKVLFLIFSLTSIVSGVVLFNTKRISRKILEKIFLLPIIKNYMIKLSLIRFFRSFAYLLLGGQSYVNALKLSTNVLKHPLLEKIIKPLEEKLVEGESLSNLLKDKKYIPSLVPRMLSIAEETSDMPKILLNIANIYEDEITKTTQRMVAFLQPVLLIVLGIIIGFVVLSVLLPLTDVSSFIGE